MQKEMKAFKALGDENRLTILSLLYGGEKCACMLLEEMKISQPTLSHHMKILCDCGIVTARKDWKWTHYSLNCALLSELITYLGDTKCRKTTEE